MKINNSEQIIFEIRKIMSNKHISVSDLAKNMNMPRPSLAARFQQKNISFNSLIEICNALDLDIYINFIPKDDAK